MSDLIPIYNNLMSQISALRAEAKEAASHALHETTKQYFEKYGDTVEQIFWNQYTPWFNDGDTCEFSVGDIHIVLLSDESEDKYSEGSYFTDDTVYLKTQIADWERFNADPEAYKDALEAANPNYFSKWHPRERFYPHYETLADLQAKLEQTTAWPEGFAEETQAIISFISSLDEDILEELFDNHVTVRITASGIETEEYSHE